jgi:hypothetical protein
MPVVTDGVKPILCHPYSPIVAQSRAGADQCEVRLLSDRLAAREAIQNRPVLKSERRQRRGIFECIRIRNGGLAGSSQIGLIRFFDPFRYLHWRDGPFRQMRIERARTNI